MAEFSETTQGKDGRTLNSYTYRVISPEGVAVMIPKELFNALRDFLIDRRNSGSIEIGFRNGSIAEVDSLTKKTYK